MPEYTPLGIEKIVKQVEHNLELIRCPRDSVVMRVLGGRAERRDGSGRTERFTYRLPTPRYWDIREIDLECPACRRSALGVPVGQPAAGPPSVARGSTRAPSTARTTPRYPRGVTNATGRRSG